MPPTSIKGIGRVIIALELGVNVIVLIVYAITLHKANRLGGYPCTKSAFLFLSGFGGVVNSHSERNKRRMLQTLAIIMIVFCSTWFAVILLLGVLEVAGK